jgi:hypothetical protein
VAAGVGFKPVYAQRSGYFCLVYLEIQDDKALAEGLPQQANQKYYRPPFIQTTLNFSKDIR